MEMTFLIFRNGLTVVERKHFNGGAVPQPPGLMGG